MTLEAWDELRTALHVTRAGTVSGAAQALGVHHATVIRHVDALEDRLGVKLFQRHAKGYTATEAGQALFETAAEAEMRFEQMAARLRSLQSGLSGDLVITTIPELSSFLLPTLAELIRAHPTLVPCLRIEERVLRLEYGEAHLAIRAGARPSEPDNVVQPLGKLPIALFAAPSYLEVHGAPTRAEELSAHRFIGPDNARAPYEQWLAARELRIGFRSNAYNVRLAAMESGLGLGFLPAALEQPGLVRLGLAEPDWASELWLVTHVDLHRSPKVQMAAQALKPLMSRLARPESG